MISVVFTKAKQLRDRYRPALLVLVLLALLLVPRINHLTGPIDTPHDWRQCDTDYDAYRFYTEGIDILYPAVCWMGGFKTFIRVFPFPELLMAIIYRLFGHHLILSRLLTLSFFAGSAVYFYLILSYVFDRRYAVISTAVYLVLPLSIFFSRAILIDFFAVFFAHGMSYHLMRGYEDGHLAHWLAALVFSSLAFLVKATCVFYFALPLLVFVVAKPRIRRILILVLVSAVPITLFILWRIHAERVNAQAPNWFFFPGYRRLVHQTDWYFGSLAMRFDLNVWQTLFDRFRHEVASSIGAVLFLGGVVGSPASSWPVGWKRMAFLWGWLIGAIGYLILFLNLNFVHNYYQIPLLAPVAMFVAVALELILRLSQRFLRRMSWLPALCLYSLPALGCVRYAESHYYWVNKARVQAGDTIDKATAPESLLIAAIDDEKTRFTDPRWLYHAKRNGWSIQRRYLSGHVVDRLKGEGADYLAVMTTSDESPDKLFGYTAQVFVLKKHPWRVILCNLHEPTEGLQGDPPRN